MTGRLVHVLTVADSLIFIDTVVRRARDAGLEVTVITSPDERLTAFGRRLGVRTVGIEMPRRVSPLEDWVALTALRRELERIGPDIVHAHTPKGGLLGTLAAASLQVPTRVYQMRGLAFVTAKGVLREVLKTTERLSCNGSTHVICQSHSLREQALAEGLVSAEKSRVILEGSNGVDLVRFDPRLHEAAGLALRTSLGFDAGHVVFAFVGRLVRDKGIPELVTAFTALATRDPRVRLVVAGPWEPRDPVPADVRHQLEHHPAIRVVGPVKEPAVVYAASDVVVLPSHREGFPNVPLEAAAMERAVVSTTVPGCRDAVADGETGWLVAANDATALEGALDACLNRPERLARGRAGRVRAGRSFSRERIADEIVALYLREIAAN